MPYKEYFSYLKNLKCFKDEVHKQKHKAKLFLHRFTNNGLVCW